MNKLLKFSLSTGLALGLFLTLSSRDALALDKSNYNQGTVTWSSIMGTNHYHIYYRESGEDRYTHAVRRLPKTSIRYTIGYLKKGVGYRYEVKAVNDSGAEFWTSGVKSLLTTWMR